MIFIKPLNILFLKPRKVAGTSFEIALSQFVGQEDIVTPIAPYDEEMRRSLGFPGPQNFLKPIREYSAKEIYQLARYRRRAKRYFEHISAKETLQELGVRKFSEAIKVSIARNPYDMLVSAYHFKTKQMKPPPSFRDWVNGNPAALYHNREQYYIDGKDVIDFYLRFEHLSEDCDLLEQNIPGLKGLAGSLEKIKAKGSIRPRHIHLQEYYEGEAELIGVVKFFNRQLIQKFEYSL